MADRHVAMICAELLKLKRQNSWGWSLSRSKIKER